MADSNEVDEEFPTELQDRLSNFDECLTEVEEILKPLHDVPINELQAKMTALERAKLDLLGAYAMNSLFWVFLNTKGENPKEHGIKQEIDRIRTYMGRVKEIEDRAKAPKVDKAAAKRFVRNALWQQAHQQTSKPETGSETKDSAEQSAGSSTSKDVDSAAEQTEIPAKKMKIETSSETRKRSNKHKNFKDND